MTGKTLRGRRVTMTEVENDLGSPSSWRDAASAVLQHEQHVRPIVKLAPADQAELGKHPQYVAYSLARCARRVLEAPRAVFEGLRRDNDPTGRAYCGRPALMFDNAGDAHPAPKGMVYIVYMRNNHVFDWDWVKADPHDSDLPIDWRVRFNRRLPDLKPLTLDGVGSHPPNRFSSKECVYSGIGDCIFAYFLDKPAFAQRVNSDVTVFRSMDEDRPVGFKIKNVKAIVDELNSVRDGLWSNRAQELTIYMIVSHSQTRRVLEGSKHLAYSELLGKIDEIKPRVHLDEALAAR